MAGEIYRELVATHEDNPGESRNWGCKVTGDYGFWRPEKLKSVWTSPDPKVKAILEKARVNRYAKVVRAYLDRKGYLVDDESLLRIKQATNSAMMQAHELLLRYSEGDYRPDADAVRFPELQLETGARNTAPPVDSAQPSPLEVFDRYAKESQVKPATIKRWRPIVAKVQKEHP